jgi:quercetin dioxygenase-like cupin family protein
VSDPVLIPSGGGEIIGDSAARRVEILGEHETLHATWSRFGPRRAGADLHVHHRHTDLFYVLDGEVTVMLGTDGEEVVVPAGTLARVPPRVVHGFRNGSDADVRYLNFHAPGTGFADFLRGLRDGRTVSFDQHPPPPDGGRPISEAVVSGDGFVAARDGIRVALLADVDEIGIAEVSIESASTSEPHVHRHHVESLYVLDGALAIEAGGGELRADAGSWVKLPAGVPHSLAASAPVRFLDVHTPSCGFGAYVRSGAAFDQVPA